jgi:transcriptional regulator with XRE-family HTH domain
MKISDQLADEGILAEIGLRMAQRRLELQLTQAQLAEQAGVAKRTVERIEAGASAQMSSLIRLFRVLGLLPGLDQLVAEAGPRPMDLLRLKGRRRQRASSRRVEDTQGQPWSWEEDT